MDVRQLAVPGAWELTPRQFPDARGRFLEWFTDESFAEATGHRLDLRQANLSVSAAGVVRGIHYADVPPGQAKYVTCVRGAVLDVAVDIRVGSPTFGTWDTVLLDDRDRRVIYLSEGLGHAFMALEDDSTVTYLCSTGYNPRAEHGIRPDDAALGIEWPTVGRDGRALEPLLSDKDLAAPTLAEAREQGKLPDYLAVQAWVASLQER